MTKNKTTQNASPVEDFINAVDNEQKRKDSWDMIALMKKITGSEPKMWGSSLVGFGSYHYKYESGHEGDAPILGFSPRKAAFSLYVYSETERSKRLLVELGKFKMGKACIYIKKLEDINIPTLQELCVESIKYINENNECSCRKKQQTD